MNIEEILQKYIEKPFSHTEVIEKDNAMKFAKEVWDAACEAQMNAVYDHCAVSQTGTNGHAIKHWVKQAPFN